MMNRKRFLRSSAGLALAPLFARCGVIDTVVGNNGSSVKTASVNMLQLAQAIEVQQCEEWCWAASISMIFGFYGHAVSQAAIVAQTYGQVACLPANTTTTIGLDLSRSYIDAAGRPFTSQVTAAYDYYNGYNSLSNAGIVNELNSNRPLLFCNISHAEVLYSVEYSGLESNPTILGALVIDPWPATQGSHPLSTQELYPVPEGGTLTFLASVRVS